VRRVTTLVVLALALAACGGGGDAQDVLADTAANLGEIRSGTLDFGLLVTPRSGEEFGFEVHGPFSFAKSGALPVLDVEYTQIANGQRGSVTLISTGEAAYARVGEEVTELSADQAETLRAAVGELERDGGLEQFPIGDWVTDAEVSEDGDVERVEGELDIVATVNGLVDLARGFGREVPRIEGESAEQLRRATRSTLFELRTGKEDRLLRRLRLEADFALEVPPELRSALGDLVGAKVAFRLGVERPNRTVTVEDPTR
jgi:hypothetical protein